MHRLLVICSILAIGSLPILTLAAPTASPTEPAAAVFPPSGELPFLVADAECTGTNLATDPSFEGTFQNYVPEGGHPECPDGVCTSVRTPPDWTPWWTQNQGDPLRFKMPEFTTETPESNWYGPYRIRSGNQNQQHFSLFSTHEGGVYQQINATKGNTYCFSIWGHSWSAQDDPIPEQNHRTCPSPQGVGDACSGPNDGTLTQKIGIDPTGGTDWTSSNIVWSNARTQYDVYGVFEVQAIAQADKITIFTHAIAADPVKHNNAYWDDAVVTGRETFSIDGGSTIATMATITDSTRITQTVTISINPPSTFSGATSWTATLTNTSGLSITTDPASPISGNSGDSVTVTIDTNGLPVGSYAAELAITPDSPTVGDPVPINIQAYVVNEVFEIYLPIIQR